MQKRRTRSSVPQNAFSLRNFTSAVERREYLEKKLKLNLQVLANNELEKNKDVHCENLIGSVDIPLGVAGPLLLKGQNIKKEKFVPLATTEGALIASINRGTKAIYESGGATVKARLVGQTRGPVFKTGGIEQGLKLKQWIEKNKEKISVVSQNSSPHLEYLDSKVKIIGSNTFIRFLFNTDKAMGMNMVTIACEAIVRMIEMETKIKCIAIAGNYDIDKKPAWLNIIDGRGYEVWAECLIKKNVLKDSLKTASGDIFSVWMSKVVLGSYSSGSLGFNSHFANIIAAIFIATGQDPAHVVEGSCGITVCEVIDDDLLISINLPSLIIGIVGGGTKLPAQKTALRLLGISEKSTALDFAEVIAGALLAGELSLLAALATKALGNAHASLGRRIQ